MQSFLTNTAATVALRNLGLTPTSFGKAQAQISSGLQVADASDLEACWSIGVAMKSRVDTLSTVNAGLDLNKALFDMTTGGSTTNLSAPATTSSSATRYRATVRATRR